MPTQVFLSVTPSLQSFLEQVGAEEAGNGGKIDLDEIYRLADKHAKAGNEPLRIHEVLAGAEVVARRQVQVEPVTELERLRLESQERCYQRQVRGVAPAKGMHRVDPQIHQSGLRFATNFATQVAVAFIGAFLLGYYFVETFVTPDNFSAKVIAGAFCSFFTLLLETMLLVVHEHKQELINQRSQAKEDRNKRLPLRKDVTSITQYVKSSGEQSVEADATELPTEEPAAAPKRSREKKED